MNPVALRLGLVALVVALAACSVVDPFGDFRFVPLDAPGADVPFIDAPSDDVPAADVANADAGFDAHESSRDVPAGMDVFDAPPLDAPDVMDAVTAQDAPDVADVVTVRDAPDVADVVTLRDVPDVPDSGACGPGQTFCGRCTDTQSDMFNCGRCGNICQTRPNTTSVSCVGGQCVLGCTGGFGNCDGDELNGCETDVRASSVHCGRCRNACMLGQVCSNGGCTGVTCPANTAECDLNPTVLCETNLLADANHCGACGTQCPTGFGCRNGVCLDFAGTFTTNMMPPCPNSCDPPNPYSGVSCTCPPGFRAAWLLQLLSTCSLGVATASRSSLYICGGPAPSRFAGSYQIDTMTGACASLNNYLSPAGCGCPAGATAHTFNVSLSGATLATTICVGSFASTARSAFGGFYVQDATATDGGLLCRVANPVATGCSCPAGFTTSRGTRFFWVSSDVRERTEAELVFCSR